MNSNLEVLQFQTAISCKEVEPVDTVQIIKKQSSAERHLQRTYSAGALKTEQIPTNLPTEDQ